MYSYTLVHDRNAYSCSYSLLIKYKVVQREGKRDGEKIRVAEIASERLAALY
jgi:hypothetical protein